MPNPEPPLPKKHGCFFYGCITSLILLLLLVVGLFLAARFAISRVNKMVAEYTDSSAVSVPKADIPEDEMKKLNERVAAFNAAVDAHSNTPPLILTSREINGLLANNPDMKEFKDKFYVSLEGDVIKGQVSLPLDTMPKIPLLDLKGRYLNGSGTFKASVDNGALSVYVEDLEVHGKPLPAEFMKGLQSANLAQSFTNNPNSPQPFQKYDSVQVKDSTLIIKPKQN